MDRMLMHFDADVIAPNWWTALRAAKQGRVLNWRWKGTFAIHAGRPGFEYLYRVADGEARSPDRPLTHRAYREHKRQMARRGLTRIRYAAKPADLRTRKAA